MIENYIFVLMLFYFSILVQIEACNFICFYDENC